MTVGRWTVRVGRTLWGDLGWHWFDGRKRSPICGLIRDGRAVWMRGISVSWLGLEVWVQWEDR